MEQVYIFMLVALFALAVIDLVVGVSNDAVNFLNSAIGSKVAPVKTIMIVASVGVAIGAIFSSGMMEIARKGIFNPDSFVFSEIMIIFIAVMITDILLLDLFNSLGLPTSTTVSIVFELLGAAVCIAMFKVYDSGGGFADISNYINVSKATEIIWGIFLSVLIAFSVGSIVQYFSRIIFSFHYNRNLKYTGGIFGGIALTSLTYFILIKGLKGISFVPDSVHQWVSGNTYLLILVLFIFWTLLSQVLISVFKKNVLKFIILTGTFGLAMAFAGNDLVNFIGVPIAAWQSFQFWVASSVDPDSFAMSQLAAAVKTPTALLLLAGIIMVVTLWLSKKAKTVVETEIGLAKQSEGAEKFSPNFLSRLVVRSAINLNGGFIMVMPKSLQARISSRFEKTEDKKTKKYSNDEPAFDLVRAAVNLTVASILISLGTSLKLPLSTTYVTFMVAMGTSLADRAWGRESAVYRVAGVFNVIGGWFVTALVAFVSAAVMAFIIHLGGIYAVVALLIVAGLLLARSFMAYKNAQREKESKRKFDRVDLITIHEIVNESSENIADVLGRISKLYGDVINNLGLQDLPKLKKNRKNLKKLEDEVDELKGDLFYFIKSLDESSVEASKFYILTLDYLQDMVQSIGYIVRNSYSHVNNNHKSLKFNQVRDLKSIENKLKVMFDKIQADFDKEVFENIGKVVQDKKILLDDVSAMIQKQIERIRSTETSPKNTKLYFGILLETKDLITATINLLQLFREFNDDYKKLRK